tara:strand:+ start:253 stop:447 length:195 start_codon:yes stop_codon:yes gene_type:complete
VETRFIGIDGNVADVKIIDHSKPGLVALIEVRLDIEDTEDMGTIKQAAIAEAKRFIKVAGDSTQ